MKFSYLKVLLPAATLLMATGCMDDNYDLSDINTTTRININDLSVPVKLKALEIDNLIDLEDNENIKVITDANGNQVYSIYKEGEIDSDPIAIDPVHVNAQNIQPSSAVCDQSSTAVTAPGQIAFDVKDSRSTFSYSSASIDDAIESIDFIETAEPIFFTMTVNLPAGLSAQQTLLKNMVLEFPKGLMLANGTSATSNIGKYDAATGLLKIDSYDAGSARQVTIKLKVERIDFAINNVVIKSDRSFSFDGEMGIMPEGHIYVTPVSGSTISTQLAYSADYKLDDFYVKNFTGSVNYLIEGVDIEPVDLSSLPEFLKDKQTQIKLSNPQIYLSVTNTTADYKTYANAQLKLVSNFNDGTAFRAESPVVEVSAAQGPTTPCNIVLSPQGNNLTPMPEFANGIHKYEFTALSNVLCGTGAPAGLPHNISVGLDNPRFLGHAEKFPIKVPGTPKSQWEIAPVTGKYVFVAPLAFDAGSLIEYNKTDDGFSSEDFSDLHVKYVTLTATATSNVPMTMKLTVHPVHKNADGSFTKMGVVTPIELAPGQTKEITFKIAASANDADDVYMTGIDGISYSAYISQDSETAGQPLAPTETIHLENVKVKVSGYYEKEL